MADIIHILNGDALRENFPKDLKGELITFREMMMEGPVNAESIENLILIRSKYFCDFYTTEIEEYYNKSAKELEKICSINSKSKVYLWFEYDLFCQVNMWCVIHMLTTWNNVNNIEIVYPSHPLPPVDWHGFAAFNPSELSALMKDSILLLEKDIDLNNQIWTAYASSDIHSLKLLSKEKSKGFPLLFQSIQDHIDRLPIKGQSSVLSAIIKDLITKHGKENFGAIFREFSSLCGRYGMGDLQLKRLVNEYNDSIY